MSAGDNKEQAALAARIQAGIHAEIEAERKLYTRAVSVGQDGKVTLTMTASDWRLFTDMKGVDEVAARLNEQIAEEINAGYSGAELVRRCHAILQLYSKFGGGDSEPSWALCKLLVHAKGEPEYHRFERHYSDYLDGWRQIGTVDAEHGCLWIGDYEDTPPHPPRPRAGLDAPPVALHQYARGLCVTFQGHHRDAFRVEGLYPRVFGGRLAEIRVVLY